MKLRRNSLSLAIACGLVAAVGAVAACATDSGSAVFGPSFGNVDRDGGTTEAGVAVTDAGEAGANADADADGGVSCSAGKIAVLAGSDAALTVAVASGEGTWASAPVTGGAARSRPALAAFQAGFLGIVQGLGDVLQSITAGPSAPLLAAIGTAGVKGPPSLAVVDGKAHVVYAAGAGQNRLFFHGTNTAGTWDAANDPVGTPQSFGTIGAALAGAANAVVFAENGQDNGLYVRSFTQSWSASAAIVGAGTVGNAQPVPPVLVSVDGALDLVLLYAQQDKRIAFATREAAGAVWTDRNETHVDSFTTEPFAAARIGQSTLLVTFRGDDGNAYASFGAASGTTFTFTKATLLAPSVDSAPAIARGICGDDAVVAFASQGAVKITRLRGASFTPPEAVTGAAGKFVAIATR